jgi:hypothetical protein
MKQHLFKSPKKELFLFIVTNDERYDYQAN